MRRSLQWRLALSLSAITALLALAAGVISYQLAFYDAIEIQDDQLREVAGLISRQTLALATSQPAKSLEDIDPEDRIIVQILPPAPGAPITSLSGLSPNMAEGMQKIRINGHSWRVLAKSTGPSSRLVVGQLIVVRDEIAQNSALTSVVPLLALIPLLVALVFIMISSHLKPLRRLSHEVAGRAADDLRPVLAPRLPLELQPFIAAINQLFGRVSLSVAQQRRFIADAAHELRSPLTALSLQAERLQAAPMSATARTRLEALQGGLKRARNLLEQLLALARVQENTPLSYEQISMAAIFAETLEDLLPLAQAKNQDIGVISKTDIQFTGRAGDVRTLVKNLAENAIRYTQPGGQIDLSARLLPNFVESGFVEIEIADNGPGIPASEHERVFDPFYRVLGSDETGSGLGLSIVRAIVARLGGKVSLSPAHPASTPPQLPGLRVTVRLPVQLMGS